MSQKTLLIYLVDDDQEDRMLFRESLDEIEIPVQVHEFDNGVTLIDTLLNPNHALPDAIYLDMNMPLMNGEECIDDIRSENIFSQIPIIIYSTYVDEQMLNRLQKKGANWYLIKPDSFEKLKKLLLKSLEFIQSDSEIKNESSHEDFIITIT